MDTNLAPSGAGRTAGLGKVLIVAGAVGATGLVFAMRALSGSSKQTCVSPSQLSCP